MVVTLPEATVDGKTYTIDLRLRELRCATNKTIEFTPLSAMHASLIYYALTANDHGLLIADVREAIENGK